MKTPKNLYTTPEQSKRLLEIGVPADTADCYMMPIFYTVWVRSRKEEKRSDWFDSKYHIPCWSAATLMWIYTKCKANAEWDIHIALSDFECDRGMCELIVEIMEDFVSRRRFGENLIDFSKLEG